MYTKNNFLQVYVGTPTGGCSLYEGGWGVEFEKNEKRLWKVVIHRTLGVPVHQRGHRGGVGQTRFQYDSTR